MLSRLEVFLSQQLRWSVSVGGVSHRVSGKGHDLDENVGHFSELTCETIIYGVEGEDVQ